MTTTCYIQQFTGNQHTLADYETSHPTTHHHTNTQSHNYQDSNTTSTNGMQHNTLLIQREEIP